MLKLSKWSSDVVVKGEVTKFTERSVKVIIVERVKGSYKHLEHIYTPDKFTETDDGYVLDIDFDPSMRFFILDKDQNIEEFTAWFDKMTKEDVREKRQYRKKK